MFSDDEHDICGHIQSQAEVPQTYLTAQTTLRSGSCDPAQPVPSKAVGSCIVFAYHPYCQPSCNSRATQNCCLCLIQMKNEVGTRGLNRSSTQYHAEHINATVIPTN